MHALYGDDYNAKSAIGKLNASWPNRMQLLCGAFELRSKPKHVPGGQQTK